MEAQVHTARMQWSWNQHSGSLPLNLCVIKGLVVVGEPGELLHPSGTRDEACQTAWGLGEGRGEQICPGGWS